jgi:hypothetical protein
MSPRNLTGNKAVKIVVKQHRMELEYEGKWQFSALIKTMSKSLTPRCKE